jgi:rhodanese-related sulfurtransferase
MKNKVSNVFGQLQAFEQEIGRLEGRILELEQRLENLIQVERNHLIRVKNHEEISDDFIYNGRKYLDLSPDKAWKMYQNQDADFIIIDVSAEDYEPQERLAGAIHMPWEDFTERFLEVTNQTTPLLIISEDGTNSVLACEFLAKRGYYNCNNVSGGYKHWRGFRLESLKGRSA